MYFFSHQLFHRQPQDHLRENLEIPFHFTVKQHGSRINFLGMNAFLILQLVLWINKTFDSQLQVTEMSCEERNTIIVFSSLL